MASDVSEEARTKAIEAVAPYPAVVVDQLIGLGWTPPASATPEREAMRAQIAKALYENANRFHETVPWEAASDFMHSEWLGCADAVLAVLPSREAVEDAADVIATVKAHSMLAAGLTLTPNDVDALVLWINKHEARESVAPTREQVLDLLNSPQHAPMATHDGRTGECLACPVPLYELGPDAVVDAVLALLPGEPREAVEAKARAEVVEYVREHFIYWYISHNAGGVLDQLDHKFGIGADRG